MAKIEVNDMNNDGEETEEEVTLSDENMNHVKGGWVYPKISDISGESLKIGDISGELTSSSDSLKIGTKGTGTTSDTRNLKI